MSRIFSNHNLKELSQNIDGILTRLENEFEQILYLNSNEKGPDFLFLGILKTISNKGRDSFETLKKFINTVEDYVVGYLPYDLKNELEDLSSCNTDYLNFSTIHFYQPRWVIKIDKNEIQIGYHPQYNNEQDLTSFIKLLQQKTIEDYSFNHIELTPRISRKEYLSKVNAIKKHIQHGDIYEANFTFEFFAENTSINPTAVYQRLNQLTQAPFSCFMKNKELYLLCGSPERFLKKEENRIVSQPIKGTKPRGKNEAKDEALKTALLNDKKERSENVMIVDLVRNDLSKTAKKASVKVEELFGIYTFETVHQMISTVTSKLRDDIHPVDCIKYAFPIGSMTGTPKIRAMEIIEEQEESKRGLYSGAVGYFTPKQDFDFNVVIRSILYNAKNQYLSTMVGGAITSKSTPEQEYEECLVKVNALKKTLSSKNY